MGGEVQPNLTDCLTGSPENVDYCFVNKSLCLETGANSSVSTRIVEGGNKKKNL